MNLCTATEVHDAEDEKHMVEGKYGSLNNLSLEAKVLYFIHAIQFSVVCLPGMEITNTHITVIK